MARTGQKAAGLLTALALTGCYEQYNYRPADYQEGWRFGMHQGHAGWFDQRGHWQGWFDGNQWRPSHPAPKPSPTLPSVIDKLRQEGDQERAAANRKTVGHAVPVQSTPHAVPAKLLTATPQPNTAPPAAIPAPATVSPVVQPSAPVVAPQRPPVSPPVKPPVVKQAPVIEETPKAVAPVAPQPAPPPPAEVIPEAPVEAPPRPAPAIPTPAVPKTPQHYIPVPPPPPPEDALPPLSTEENAPDEIVVPPAGNSGSK
ncbi:hypothetical protein [Acetobacter sp.]|uniref:hypothetical protein n=1 Tax=Acetobacter sp. TaxID=440 RepID=UPI0039EBB468